MRRVLTGIRPTGKLHLGHYVGALQQWLPLQDDHECFFLVADVQALTTHSDRPELIERSVYEVLLDWLAVGLDPRRSNVHLVLQSHVHELYELTELLGMVTPHSWILHNPTIAAEIAKLKQLISVGFMHYPVSQASDILFCSPNPRSDPSTILVPVGEDQIPHLRNTNRIARAFNHQYGATFVECEPLVGQVGRLVGTDGSDKMSKSGGNCIFLSESEDSLRKKVRKMKTDTARVHADVAGNPDNCLPFTYLDAFANDVNTVEELKARYREGTVRDVEVKDYLFEVLNQFLEPIRQRREAAAGQNLYHVLMRGTEEARQLATQTIERVRQNMHLNYDSLRG